MNKEKRPECVTDEHLEYLDSLRESGASNMFGAQRYVTISFGVSKDEARVITKYWMDTFGKDER